MPEPAHMVVVGEGVATGVPDQCVLQAGVNVLAESAAEAVSRVSVVAAQVTDVLRQQGIGAADMRTTHLGVQDFFDQSKSQVTARIATYHLEIVVRDIDLLGELLASLVAAADDSFQIRSLQLAIGDPEPLRQEARRHAVDDARRRAAQLAEAADVRLGRVVTIQQDDSAARPPAWGFASRASASEGVMIPPVPIEPGNLSVTERITLTYEMQ